VGEEDGGDPAAVAAPEVFDGLGVAGEGRAGFELVGLGLGDGLGAVKDQLPGRGVGRICAVAFVAVVQHRSLRSPIHDAGSRVRRHGFYRELTLYPRILFAPYRPAFGNPDVI
jgi:hypothetical protein